MQYCGTAANLSGYVSSFSLPCGCRSDLSLRCVFGFGFFMRVRIIIILTRHCITSLQILPASIVSLNSSIMSLRGSICELPGSRVSLYGFMSTAPAFLDANPDPASKSCESRSATPINVPRIRYSFAKMQRFCSWNLPAFRGFVVGTSLPIQSILLC
jgi:hypothetical protein